MREQERELEFHDVELEFECAYSEVAAKLKWPSDPLEVDALCEFTTLLVCSACVSAMHRLLHPLLPCASGSSRIFISTSQPVTRPRPPNPSSLSLSLSR